MKTKGLWLIPLLALSFFFQFPMSAVHASGPVSSVVYPSAQYTALHSNEVTTWFASGLVWAFFVDNTPALAYKTSSDGGATWSTLTEITTSGIITTFNGVCAGFSTWLTGTTLYYVTVTTSQCGGGTDVFFYRHGTLNPGGTITWAGAEASQASAEKKIRFPFIFVDSSGNPWVSFTSCSHCSTFFDIEVWHFSGSWQHSVIGNTTDGLDFSRVMQYSPSNHMILSFTDGTSLRIYASQSSDGGATWSAPVVSALTNINDDPYFAPVVAGSSLYAVLFSNTDHHLHSLSFTDNSGSWNAANQMPPTFVNAGGPAVSAGAATLTEWISNSSEITPWASTDQGVTWKEQHPSITGGGTPTYQWLSPFSLGSTTQTFGTVTYACVGSPCVADIDFESNQAVSGPDVLITVVGPCNYTQLQCWWFPSLFMLLFSGFFLAVAGVSRSSPKTAMHLFLSGLTYGSFVAVIFGIMNIVLPMALLLINTLYILRMRGK